MTRNPRPIRLTHRPYAVQADTVVVEVDEKALEMAVLEERLEMKRDDRDEAEREQYVDRLRMAGLL